MRTSDEIRYGVFLVPDARTSAAITNITGYLRAQFGLLSAHRFPPHVTLAGSLPVAVAETVLLEAVRDVASRHHQVEVVNVGPRRLGQAALVFDVHHDGMGNPNLPLVELAADVTDTVLPLLEPVHVLPADVRDRASWRGHLSLASHDLLDRPDLCDEVEDFVHQLDEPYPGTFVATRVAVYRLRHQTWRDGWWTDFTWEHVRSLRLESA